MSKKKTKEEFIKEATEKHKGKYDYSKVEYVNNKTKVCIICPNPEHGEFYQTPSDHLSGKGCPTCGGTSALTKEKFIKKARKVHKYKYDYSKVEYVNIKTKVCIICSKPEHGEFWQTPHAHLQGQGCPKCANENKGEYCRLSKEEFITKARSIHGDKYDYSKVEYVNSYTKVCIICSEHGEFWQTPNGHLQGQGCHKCKGDKNRESKTSTKEDFIKKAREIHGQKYDYSKVEYVNNKTKVCINCREHGEFWQVPSNHIQGNNCPECAKIARSDSRRLSKEDFIKKAREKHKDKYDYSKVNYVNCETKVCIICTEPEHGEFWQIPSSHLNGNGCPKCGGCYVQTKEEFIIKAKEIHGDKYDYSKVEYVNNKTKVCINCREHGEFWQTPNAHLSGQGCSKCSGKYSPTKEEWIASARKVHGDKYDYSKVDYVNNATKVCIICPEHGVFKQAPYNHTQGQGCPTCGQIVRSDSNRYSLSDFIAEARKIHCDKYDYSKVDYVNSKTKVCIICPEHGKFLQVPSQHLIGQGCPKCNLSHLERSVMNYLDEHGFTYDYQKRFDWLGRQSLDFYLPDYNVGIECQGGQHFFPVERFGGDKAFKNTLERDKRKKALCEEHDIKLLYFGDTPNYDTFLGEVVHNDVQYLIDYLKK
nr:MAG TPA: restriction enzyme [Bacteriophage sp.]